MRAVIRNHVDDPARKDSTRILLISEPIERLCHLALAPHSRQSLKFPNDSWRNPCGWRRFGTIGQSDTEIKNSWSISWLIVSPAQKRPRCGRAVRGAEPTSATLYNNRRELTFRARRPCHYSACCLLLALADGGAWVVVCPVVTREANGNDRHIWRIWTL